MCAEMFVTVSFDLKRKKRWIHTWSTARVLSCINNFKYKHVSSSQEPSVYCGELENKNTTRIEGTCADNGRRFERKVDSEVCTKGLGDDD